MLYWHRGESTDRDARAKAAWVGASVIIDQQSVLTAHFFTTRGTCRGHIINYALTAATGARPIPLNRRGPRDKDGHTFPHGESPKEEAPVYSTVTYSTVTDLARLRGWSTSQPRRTAR